MKATVISFLTSLEKNDLNSSILILDEVMASIQVEEFSKTLKHHILLNEYPHKFYLKIRDCFADYLGFGPVYFALLQPSYDIFRMVSSAKSRSEAQELLADFVISSVQKGVSQIDLSFLEIDSLTKPPYVLLVPYLLSTRATELETCRIPFSLQSSSIRQNSRYCLTDLLRTHYGRKIVSAFEFDSDYPVVGKSTFQELYEILQSFGLDVNSMLVRIPEEEWPKVVKEGTQDLEQEYKGSDEIWLLYRTYLAMVGLNSDDSNTVLNSMLTIDRNRTSYCNDALIPLIQNGSLEVKMKAIRLIEKTLDFSKIDLLCSLLSGTPLRMRNAVIRAISTIESAHNFLKLAPPPRSKPHIDTYPQNPELIESYIAALNKLTKSSSSIARIDAVKALSAIKLPDVENHLRQLMNDEDPKVRLAVLNACVNLPKDKVVDILRLGIQDIEPFVEKEALRLFEERWPDSYW